MMTTLTKEQISLIQSTWAIPAKNAVDSGEAILLAYFEKYPKNQDKFSSFKNTPLLSLKVCLQLLLLLFLLFLFCLCIYFRFVGKCEIFKNIYKVKERIYERKASK